VQTTKFKDVLNFLGSNLDIDGYGTTRKFSRNGVLQKALPVFWKYGFASARRTNSSQRRRKIRSRRRLQKKPNATVYSYSGQRHAFSRHNGAYYNAAAAALANRRTSEFLKQQLL
jgi:dienelactone hydrolase